MGEAERGRMRLTERQADRQTDKKTAYRQTNRQIDRQAGRQTDRQLYRQIDKQGDCKENEKGSIGRDGERESYCGKMRTRSQNTSKSCSQESVF